MAELEQQTGGAGEEHESADWAALRKKGHLAKDRSDARKQAVRMRGAANWDANKAETAQEEEEEEWAAEARCSEARPLGRLLPGSSSTA